MATQNIFLNKKLAIPILLALAVLVIFFLREDVTGLFTAAGDKTIPISASLATDFSTSISADTLTIKFKAPSADVFIGGDKLEVLGQQDIELKLEGYKGKLSYGGSKLSLKGQAKKAFVNSVGRTAKRENFAVETKELVISSASLAGAAFNSFSSPSVTGSLDLNNGKIILNPSSEPLQTGAFSGDIELADVVKLSGFVSKISTKGINIGAEAGVKETPKPAETPQAPEPQLQANVSTQNTSAAQTSTVTSSVDYATACGAGVPIDECKTFLGAK